MCGTPTPFWHFRALHFGEGCALQAATREYEIAFADWLACERQRGLAILEMRQAGTYTLPPFVPPTMPSSRRG